MLNPCFVKSSIIISVKSFGVRNLIIFSVRDGNRTCISLTIAGQNDEIKGLILDFFDN